MDPSDGGIRKNRRILIIDDNKAIHDDIRRSLAPLLPPLEADELEAVLFDTPLIPEHRIDFELCSAYHGQDGLEQVRRALKEGAPFALVFVDVRMPPGWDGIETLSRIWEEDPALQAVVCSAYYDYSWDDIIARLARFDSLMILRKPFDTIEIRQMAYALTEKWNQQAELAAMIKALQKSEAHNRALLHAVPDAILRIDGRGVCLGFKPLMTHAGAPSPLGASSTPPPEDDLSAEMSQLLAEQTKQVIEKGLPLTTEFTAQVEGQEHHYEARIASVGEDEAVAVVRDITELKRAAAEETRMREREAAIRTQAEALMELTMPIIPINDRLVVMPLVGDMDVPRAQRVREAFVQRIAGYQADIAIIDFTGVSDLEVEVAEELMRTAQAVRLLGTQLALTGLRAAAVRSFVELSADLRGITTHQTLQQGIEYAMRER